MGKQPLSKIIAVAALVVIIAIVGYYVLNAPDRRTPGEKVGDAIHELPQGVDKAARQLEDRTPGEKLEDAVNDAGEDVKKSTNQ